MTAPTFGNFVTLLSGWVFAERRNVTGLIEAAGAVDRKHFSVYHRFFATARWSLEELGFAVLALVLPWLGEGSVLLALDDTLARKHGLKVYGAGMHHDPLLSSRRQAIMNYGHCWVTLGVLVRFPFCCRRVFCLPILFALYLNRKSAAKHRRVYRTKPELAVELAQRLARRFPHHRFHRVADSAYGGESVLGQLPPGFDLTSRLVLDARLHEAPPLRQAGTRGRPPRRGKLLPNPQQMLAGRARRVTLELYGRRDRVRLTDVEARVYKVPDRPLRVVAVDPLRGGRPRQAFYSTCAGASAQQVLTWYALRWAIEVTFHDTKGCLGLEEPQNWTPLAVRRTAPLAFLLYSLVLLWYAAEGHRLAAVCRRPWYPHKPHASFADMLATLRRVSAADISELPRQAEGWDNAPGSCSLSLDKAA
ncbi:MAG: transposase [Armatimonadetes bacterium]|nr:transposase [Armatimonadota bacterium]